jgi:hypothetical protein
MALKSAAAQDIAENALTAAEALREGAKVSRELAKHPRGHGVKPTARAAGQIAAEGVKVKGKRNEAGDLDLIDCIENRGGHVLARAKVGWRWGRAAKGDAVLAKQFEDAADKEQFKIDWAKAKYNQVVHKQKTFTQTSEDSWLKNGKAALPHPPPPHPLHHVPSSSPSSPLRLRLLHARRRYLS